MVVAAVHEDAMGAAVAVQVAVEGNGMLHCHFLQQGLGRAG